MSYVIGKEEVHKTFSMDIESSPSEGEYSQRM
jgi:hypothetical protein